MREQALEIAIQSIAAKMFSSLIALSSIEETKMSRLIAQITPWTWTSALGLTRSNTARANVIIFTCAGCCRSSLYEEDYAKSVGRTHIQNVFYFGRMRTPHSWLELKAT